MTGILVLVELGCVRVKEFSFSATGCLFCTLRKFVIARALECSSVLTEGGALIGYFSEFLRYGSWLL